MKIVRVNISDEEKKISKKILNKLPSWFGIPESTNEYIEESSSMPFWAAYDNENPIGFIAIKSNNKSTAEIYVIGIEEEYHKKGIGKKLFNEALNWCRNEEYEFLQVKTVDESREDKAYEKTRKLYKAIGFRPLECLLEIWGKDNPCLIMVMKI